MWHLTPMIAGVQAWVLIVLGMQAMILPPAFIPTLPTTDGQDLLPSKRKVKEREGGRHVRITEG